MNVFQSGWMYALGVLCVLYVLFGSMPWVKLATFLIILVIAFLELAVSMDWIGNNKI